MRAYVCTYVGKRTLVLLPELDVHNETKSEKNVLKLLQWEV